MPNPTIDDSAVTAVMLPSGVIEIASATLREVSISYPSPWHTADNQAPVQCVRFTDEATGDEWTVQAAAVLGVRNGAAEGSSRAEKLVHVVLPPPDLRINHSVSATQPGRQQLVWRPEASQRQIPARAVQAVSAWLEQAQQRPGFAGQVGHAVIRPDEVRLLVADSVAPTIIRALDAILAPIESEPIDQEPAHV